MLAAVAGDSVREPVCRIIGKNRRLAATGLFLPNAPLGFHGYRPSLVIYVNGKAKILRYAGMRPAPHVAEVAEVVAFISSPAASAVHYGVWTADGGVTAG